MGRNSRRRRVMRLFAAISSAVSSVIAKFSSDIIRFSSDTVTFSWNGDKMTTYASGTTYNEDNTY